MTGRARPIRLPPFDEAVRVGVTQRGDAVHAILESINLPVLSVPIVRDGQALIDGGLVNNIPADVLVSMGCNFVIAVSVTAKLESRFCESHQRNQLCPGTSRASCRRSCVACSFKIST